MEIKPQNHQWVEGRRLGVSGLRDLVFQCTQTCALCRTKVQGIGAQNTLISFPKASESIVD